jgi:Asp/Glu/hydantoin racemase
MKIGLIHATLAAVQPMVAAFKQHAPGAVLMHFVDEGLLPQVNREGLSAGAKEELDRLVSRAFACGVDGVLLTCSAYSPCLAAVRQRLGAPVVSADEVMLRSALEHGSRIGVVATVAAAAPTTGKLLRDYAAERGRLVHVESRVVTDAFAALQAEQPDRHEQLVREQIVALLQTCDAVVLAQISMARAIVGLAAFEKPVLTSPQAAVHAIISEISAIMAR